MPSSTRASATDKPDAAVAAVANVPLARAGLWYRVRHNRQMLIGMVCVGTFALLALLAPVIAKDPALLDLMNDLLPPSSDAPFGTDELGRDQFSRIAYGGRVSLQVAMLAVGIGLIFGVPVGLIAGYYGDRIDNAAMRIMDGLQAFPAVLLAIVIASVLGSGLTNAMIAIGIVSIPGFARLMRGQTLQIKETDYVLSARSVGASDAHIIVRHILPNGVAPIIVAAAVSSAGAILTEASLSFVGLGARPPTPSWGGMLQTGYPYLGTAIWLSLFPGLAIAVTTLGLNFLGDGLRDVLDPKLRRGGN